MREPWDGDLWVSSMRSESRSSFGMANESTGSHARRSTLSSGLRWLVKACIDAYAPYGNPDSDFGPLTDTDQGPTAPKPVPPSLVEV